MLELKRVQLKDISEWKDEKLKANLTFAKDTQLFTYVKNTEVIGIFGVLEYANKYVFKNIYVPIKHRGKGYYKDLLSIFLNTYKDKPIEATCTKMSIREFLRKGFKVIKKYNNDCTKVRYENI